MKKIRARWGLVGVMLAALLAGGCGFLPGLRATPTAPAPTVTLTPSPSPTLTPSATATPSPTLTSTPTATSTPTSTPTPETGPCMIVAESDVTVYTRASFDAMVFGTMEAGMTLQAGATAEGEWIGFEPAVAQAANIGVFRYRWVHESADLHLEGDCEDLPQLESPEAGVCYTMPMEDVSVYAAPMIDATVVATMTVGDYAAVVARGEDFAEVDLGRGNTGLDVEGWIPEPTLNLNGPCDDLPTPMP
ncbi:MAG: hypothetical protein ACP5HS_08560 [Anaerolineae bacterium]